MSHTMKPRQPTPTKLEAIKLAARAECDVRSATKFLRGEVVRGLAGERLQRVLAENKPEARAG